MRYNYSYVVIFLLFFHHNSCADPYLDTLILAESGSSEAAYKVANMLLIGDGIPENRQRAIEWLEKAVIQNHSLAISQLSRLTFETRKFNILLKLAVSGDIDAQYSVADAYNKGRGTTKDLSQADAWYKMALLNTLPLKNTDANNRKSSQDTDPEYQVDKDNTHLLQDTALKEQPASRIVTTTNETLPLILYHGTDDSKLILMDAISTITKESLVIAAAETDKNIGNNQPAETDPVAFDHLIEDFVSKTDEYIEPEITDEDSIVTNKPTAKPLPSMLPTPSTSVQPANTTDSHSATSLDPAKIVNRFHLGINNLLHKNWTRNGKPLTYLPSILTKCDDEGNRIICNSHIVKNHHFGRTMKYKSKSIITQLDGSIFKIIYRNLVLDTISKNDAVTGDSLDEEIGAVSQEAQQLQTKTGWTKPHTLECYYTSQTAIRCLKNARHTIDIVIREY